MREIFIKYNPYRLETSITIDGAAPKQNSRLNFGDRRLQEWIEELPDIFHCIMSRFLKKHITFLKGHPLNKTPKDPMLLANLLKCFPMLLQR